LQRAAIACRGLAAPQRTGFIQMTAGTRTGRVVALCGGIGGAKLALGLYTILEPGTLTLIVNTGDDFEHLGLHISPDLDTVLYTLGGVADPDRGWGRADETWNFITELGQLGGATWFRLGDRDLAMHVSRTARLRSGKSLSDVTSLSAHALGISAKILPMTDHPVRTIVETVEGDLAFQDYFVRRCCKPAVKGIRFDGAAQARPSAEAINALSGSNVRAILICPSNPYLSIDPILAVPGIRRAIKNASAPVIAVSPIIGGNAVKGPTAKIMRELGRVVNTQAILTHYRDLIDALVIDESDGGDVAGIRTPILATRTKMESLSDRTRLAREVIAYLDNLRQPPPERALRAAQ
jgi:LPPG:FO 2-phospho-L-lactate transferase